LSNGYLLDKRGDQTAISGAQNEKAAKFRRLHNGPRILILPNAWDAASARIFEDAGFPAIATTSGGGAVSLGYPDGEAAPRNEMIDATHRIARAVQVPSARISRAATAAPSTSSRRSTVR